MKPRWQQITIPIEIIVALIAASIAFIPAILHPLRVWTAGGVWCAQTDTGGHLNVLYGTENCGNPETAVGED